MKKYFLSIWAVCLLFGFTGCNSFLELESLEKVSPDALLKNEAGLKTLLASLYRRIPMEDFAYRPTQGFNYHNNDDMVSIIMSSFLTDESSRTDGTFGPGGFNYWPYSDIREVNLFFENIESAKNNGIISDATYTRLKSEAHFLRAYMYFGLAKRYGGVPLIDRVLDSDYVPGNDNAALYIPRSTEKATWEFILNDCNEAITYLPESLTTNEGMLRATKWAAYGLKSRVALHAASVAKYWDKASLGGAAVDQKLVGMSTADADYFYGECLSASKAIIDNSGISLFMPNPANAEDAAKNYQYLFLTTSGNSEIIFRKAYLDGLVYSDQGHSYDSYYSPSQSNPGWNKFGRFNPTLNLVDMYEDYTDDGKGESVKIVTRTDGMEDYAIANPLQSLNVNIPFKKYDDLSDPFRNKDARLLASIIVPGATYKGVKIIIQAGLIRQDGSTLIYADGDAMGKDGNTYYPYGAKDATQYSGFASMGVVDNSNYTTTGFTVRKYLGEDKTVVGRQLTSTTSWIDMRLAEFYLNYAEATVESGMGDMALAADLINALRRRAGHTDRIPITLANVLKERQIELAFEGFRYWDLYRRRDYHVIFNAGRRHALLPLIDLREDTPKYIFVRSHFYHDEMAGGRTFQTYQYYWSIPGINTNNLVQNPGYN